MHDGSVTRTGILPALSMVETLGQGFVQRSHCGGRRHGLFISLVPPVDGHQLRFPGK